MTLIIKPGNSWADFYARARAAAPEAFETDALRNLIGGEWLAIGDTKPHKTPVDDTTIIGAPAITADDAAKAMSESVAQHRDWSRVPLDERTARVVRALEMLR